MIVSAVRLRVAASEGCVLERSSLTLTLLRSVTMAVRFRLHKSKQACFPTEVLDGVIALLVVHFDGLRMRAADAIADGVAAHHDVLVLGGRPAHHDTVDQGPHM